MATRGNPIPPDPWRSRLARARRRRERINSERADWERLLIKHKGNVRAVARAMGSTQKDAIKAVWDLGLYPVVVRLRSKDYVWKPCDYGITKAPQYVLRSRRDRLMVRSPSFYGVTDGKF